MAFLVVETTTLFALWLDAALAELTTTDVENPPTASAATAVRSESRPVEARCRVTSSMPFVSSCRGRWFYG